MVSHLVQGTDPPDIPNDILRAIRRIIRGVSIQSKRLSKESGLTLPQIAVLRAIENAPENELSVAVVSRKVQLSPPTVSGILDRLERAGLLYRERGSADRRKVWLRLTEAGRQKLRHTPAPLQDRFVRRITELPIERQQLLLDSLETLVSFMEVETIDASPFLVAESEMKKAAESEMKKAGE